MHPPKTKVWEIKRGRAAGCCRLHDRSECVTEAAPKGNLRLLALLVPVVGLSNIHPALGTIGWTIFIGKLNQNVP